MSTKKDGIKTATASLPKKKSTSISKTSTRAREDSTDRSNAKKSEKSIKAKTKSNLPTNPKNAEVESSRAKPQNLKAANPLKSSSTTTKKNPKRAVPVTPPSNRVSKTQFFPTKNMYSNALKSEETVTKKIVASTSNEVKKSESKTDSNKLREGKTQRRISTKKVSDEKDRDKINTAKKSEEKDKDTYRVQRIEKIREASPDSSSLSERPRTATLRKGSIVNANIVGPDAPKPLISKVTKEVTKTKPPSPKLDKAEEYSYEEDFESYESDFEEYSSSSVDLNISGEETSSVSSSSTSSRVDSPKEFTSTRKRISSSGTDEERKLDSGNFDMPDYKHKQILDKIKESVEKENANFKMQEVQRNNPASLSDEGFEEQKSLQFINFLDAKKKCEHRKSIEVKRRRGEEILNMIRLDVYSFTLFDMPPVPYETFIKSYGRSNAVQTAVQTGEDDVDEIIQTDEIISESKWTQFPVRFPKIDITDPNCLQIYKHSYLGVGGENISEDKSTSYVNEYYLKKFLTSTGNLILKIIEESNSERYEKWQRDSRDIPFSDGFISFNTSQNILKNRAVKCASFCRDNSNKVMTVHVQRDQENGEYRSVICVWSILSSNKPESLLVSYGHVTCCSFGLNSIDFIYAGLNDGAISVWDTKGNIFKEDSLLKRIPLYTTEIGIGHNSEIVSLQPFVNYTERTEHFQSNKTNEICSLDQGGDVILWNLIVKHVSSKNGTISSTNWEDVVLVKNTRVSLTTMYPELADLQCTDCVVNTMDSNYIIVSTNYGFIIHHLIKGGRSNVKKFVPTSQSCANCLEVCPFSPNLFLAGFSDGNINLYSRMVEKPLMVLSDKEGQFGDNCIEIIQWSKSRPFLIYTKDISNTIHIWNLSLSDIYPVYSIPFKKNITCMKLSPIVEDGYVKKSYMVMGTEDGDLYLHVLNKDHGQQSYQMYKDHVNTFLKYVNRL